MTKDPIVEEVRRVRRQYAARFKFDLDAIYRDLKEREKKGEFKVIYRTPRRVPPIARQRGESVRIGGSSAQGRQPTRYKARG
jgi:hypothetical protein